MTGPRYTCPTCRRWQSQYDAAHEIALQNAQLLKASHDGNLELARELCAVKRRNAELLREVERLTNANQALQAIIDADKTPENPILKGWFVNEDGEWVLRDPPTYSPGAIMTVRLYADDDAETRRIRAIDQLEIDAPAEWQLLLETRRLEAVGSLEVYRVERNL